MRKGTTLTIVMAAIFIALAILAGCITCSYKTPAQKKIVGTVAKAERSTSVAYDSYTVTLSDDTEMVFVKEYTTTIHNMGFVSGRIFIRDWSDAEVVPGKTYEWITETNPICDSPRITTLVNLTEVK